MQMWKKRLICGALCLAVLAGLAPRVYALETEEIVEEEEILQEPEEEREEVALPQEEAPEEASGTVTVAMDEQTDSDAMLWGYLFGRSGMLNTQATAARDNLPTNERNLYNKLVTPLKNLAAKGGSAKVSITLSGIDMNTVDLHTVMEALLADLPYDLYWYDKVTGVSVSWSASQAVFSFNVIPRYQENGNQLRVTAAVSGVSEAVNRAKSIVAANRDLGDYAKLNTYRAEICSLTEYNFEAITGSYMTRYGYGDPWQLIYVFDGNPATNVVCEGYAKAFQYLCDLSTFSGDTRCITVTGFMNGGAHMWNIVAIGGANYLTDITNCDEGSAGAPDELFLCGVESYVAASTPDGTLYLALDGNIYYQYDMEMFSIYKDSQLALSRKAYTPSAQTHTFTYAVTVIPTQTAAGTLTGSCSHCSEHPKVTLPKLNTTDYTYHVVKAASCTAEGSGEYTWKTTTYGTFSFPVSIPMTAHKYVGGRCTACGAEDPDAVRLGDVNGDGSVNALDRLILSRYLANWEEYPASMVNMQAADVNGDGRVNAMDRVILARHLAQWEAYRTLPYTG